MLFCMFRWIIYFNVRCFWAGKKKVECTEPYGGKTMLTWRADCTLPVNKVRVLGGIWIMGLLLQWGSRHWISLVFKWWQQFYFSNCLVFSMSFKNFEIYFEKCLKTGETKTGYLCHPLLSIRYQYFILFVLNFRGLG